MNTANDPVEIDIRIRRLVAFGVEFHAAKRQVIEDVELNGWRENARITPMEQVCRAHDGVYRMQQRAQNAGRKAGEL